MTTPEPKPEWLEKWSNDIDAIGYGLTTKADVLSAIYAEVYAEASDECELMLASLTDQVNTFAREEGVEEAEGWQLEQLHAALDRVVFASRRKLFEALEKSEAIKAKARRETMEEVRERYWRSRPLLFHKDTPAMLPFEHWLKKVLAEQLKEADDTVECYQCHGLGEIAVGYDRIQDTCAVCEGSGRTSIRRIRRAAFEEGAKAQRLACAVRYRKAQRMHLDAGDLDAAGLVGDIATVFETQPLAEFEEEVR